MRGEEFLLTRRDLRSLSKFSCNHFVRGVADAWGDNLSPAYGSKIQLLGMLDLHTYPRFLRGIVAATIRNETDKPMMLDFEGGIGSAYEVSSRYPVIVVIDRQGVIRGIQKTTFTSEAFAAAREAIDAALRTE